VFLRCWLWLARGVARRSALVPSVAGFAEYQDRVHCCKLLLADRLLQRSFGSRYWLSRIGFGPQLVRSSLSKFRDSYFSQRGDQGMVCLGRGCFCLDLFADTARRRCGLV
jgi:hypothetical protein